MRLDGSALKALNLLPEKDQGFRGGRPGKRDVRSLFGLLNKCKTGQGEKMLGRWVKTPLRKKKEIGRFDKCRHRY
jgi:DNA mismatch repair protein MSH2